MALLARFDTPASVRDVPLGSPFYDNWSSFVAGLITDQTTGAPAGGFVDPTRRNLTVAGSKGLVWMGFPRDLLLPFNRDDRRAAHIAADAANTGSGPATLEPAAQLADTEAGSFSRADALGLRGRVHAL